MSEESFGNLSQAEARDLLDIPPAITSTIVEDIGGLSYAGNGLKVLRVNATADGWEFRALSDWDGEIKATKFSVGSEAEQGFNPAFVAKRTFGDFTPGSAHGFSDSSVTTFSTGASNAYASFEARIQVSGAGNYQHFVGMQMNGTFGTSGTIDDLYGFTYAPIVNTGTVTRAHGLRVFSLRGTGTITTAYGVIVEDLGANGLGGTRYAFKSEGAGDIVEIAGRADAKNWVTVSGNANPPTVAGKRLMFNFNAAFNSGAGAANIVAGDYVGGTYCELFVDALKQSFRISGSDILVLDSGGVTVNGYLHASNFSAAIQASEAIAAGSVCNIYTLAGAARVRKANATDTTKPANAFAIAAVASGANATLYFAGQVITGLAGLTPGTTYFLDTTAGGLTAAAPSADGNGVQEIGVALSATTLVFQPKAMIGV